MVDDDDSQQKPLSAHQQRHLERKRLQAEASALKKQKLKVSKTDKLAWKRDKKAVHKNLQAVQAAAEELRKAPLPLPQRAGADAGAEAPVFQGFDLPMPAGGPAETSMFAGSSR